MNSDQEARDWKLKLRYGRLTTPYRHYTAIAEGVAGDVIEGFSIPPGSTFMGMKTWASSADECADMVNVIGRQIGFTVTGRIQIYETEATQPPRDSPFGYDINFTPFDSGAEE